jgi:hypothetical protein
MAAQTHARVCPLLTLFDERFLFYKNTATRWTKSFFFDMNSLFKIVFRIQVIGY